MNITGKRQTRFHPDQNILEVNIPHTASETGWTDAYQNTGRPGTEHLVHQRHGLDASTGSGSYLVAET